MEQTYLLYFEDLAGNRFEASGWGTDERGNISLIWSDQVGGNYVPGVDCTISYVPIVHKETKQPFRLTYGFLAAIAIYAYITLGAGYEIFEGFMNHKVHASFPMILLSAIIFITRVFYAHESGANKTIYADMYGAVILTFLLLLKLYYP